MDKIRGYPREKDGAKKDHMIYITLERDVTPRAFGVPLSSATVVKVNDDKTTLYMASLLFNEADTPETSLLSVLTRISNLSHIVAWSTQAPGGPLKLAVVELPLLNLTFSERVVDGRRLLYSADHANLFVPDFSLAGGSQVRVCACVCMCVCVCMYVCVYVQENMRG